MSKYLHDKQSNGERMVCVKCQSRAFSVIVNGSCDDCYYNGFRIDDEFAEALGASPDEYHHDESLRVRASELIGFDIKRDQIETGRCKIADLVGHGCHHYRCVKCGHIQDVLVFAAEC